MDNQFNPDQPYHDSRVTKIIADSIYSEFAEQLDCGFNNPSRNLTYAMKMIGYALENTCWVDQAVDHLLFEGKEIDINAPEQWGIVVGAEQIFLEYYFEEI